ncbi:MAG: hypothetical protein MJ131_08570 [Lachnospiraceae bacterium]|nr:hypothetical protein [Lachnospiraceae bacterium]
MKKFFKALAVVLALTLVLGTIPASAAAGDVSLKKTAKTLYIGGSQGAKADGTACKVGGAALFSKLVKGFDKNTMTISVESDNNDVAEASTKSSKVTAASIGTANVTITVFEDGAEILSGVVAVNVKKNATAVTVAEGDIFDGAKVGVNTEYTVVLPRKSAGVFVDTDSRMIEASDDSVVITRVEGAPTTFTVVFTKEGEYTLTPYAYQSAKFPAVTVKGEPIKVSAALNAVSVKQSSLTAVDVEFDCSVEGLVGPANFKANSEISGVEIPFSSIKSVSVKDSVATVEFYTAFVQGTEYTIKYNDKAVGKFTAIKVAKDSVVDIAAEDIKVYNNEITAIKGVKLLDANGIDLAGNATLGGTLSYALVDADATKAFIAGENIYIKNAGETYTVEATYKYGTTELKVKFQVVSEAKPDFEFTGIDADLSGVYKIGTKNVAEDAKDVVKTVLSKTANASKVSAELQIVANFTKVENGEAKTEKHSFADAQFTAVSSDESIVMLTAKSGYTYGLIPNKEGVATILIYRTVGDKTEVCGAVPVEVVGERKATTFTASAKKNKINAAESETTEIEFSLKDQFNEAMELSGVTYEQTAGKDIATVTVVDNKLQATWVYAGSDKTFGDVTVEFKCGDLKYSVSVTVGNETDAKTQELAISADKLDTAVTEATEATKVTVSLNGVTANGFAVPGKSIELAADNKTPLPEMNVTGSGTSYVYTVSNLDASKPNKDGNDIYAVKAGNKLGVGSYVVTAYEIVYTTDANSVPVKQVNVIGSKAFTVVDTQKGLEFTKKVEKVASVAALNSAFEFKFNDAVVTAVVLDYTVDGTGKAAYVKTAKYTIANAATGAVEVTANIGALINIG